MPLPWKKSKVSRFSRIVADLQPPKPGNSSLVVETGFPTSLVDLFVKNRERLKKPIKKRKKQQQQQRQLDELVISDPIPLSSSRDLLVEHVEKTENKNHNTPDILEGRSETLKNNNNNNNNNSSEVFHQNLDCNHKEDTIKGRCDGVESNGDDKNGKCVLIAVLKMFVVVVLSLSTKRLVLGLIMSASLLICLEYIGKHYLCFLKPCLSARMSLQSLIRRVAFQSLIQKVLFFFRRSWSRFSSLKEEENKESNDDNDDGIRSISSIEEIQVAESRLDMVSRLEDKTMRDLLLWDTRWGKLDMLEDDYGGGIINGKEYSQSSKIRRRIIKKLVPKKLRAIKKGRKGKERELKEADLVSEVSSCYGGEDQLYRSEDTEEQDDYYLQGKLKLWQLMEAKKEEERGNSWREAKEEEEKEKYRLREVSEEFERTSFTTSSIGLHSKSENILVEESFDLGQGGSSGYLILFLIVLAGLVGGRVLALLITVASCSMLKLVSRRTKLC